MRGVKLQLHVKIYVELWGKELVVILRFLLFKNYISELLSRSGRLMVPFEAEQRGDKAGANF